MKIQKFTEVSASDFLGIPIDNNIQKSRYNNDLPIKCKLSDPDICYVTDIDFREKKVGWSNGTVSSVANFEDIEFIPELFY